jgi:hypothetical protein
MLALPAEAGIGRMTYLAAATAGTRLCSIANTAAPARVRRPVLS